MRAIHTGWGWEDSTSVWWMKPFDQFEPFKGFKQFLPFKGFKEFVPFKPFFTATWSDDQFW